MLDKIVRLSSKELMLVYTDREPMVLYSSKGEVLELLDVLLAPLTTSCETYSEYVRGFEDTAVINLNDLKKAG